MLAMKVLCVLRGRLGCSVRPAVSHQQPQVPTGTVLGELGPAFTVKVTEDRPLRVPGPWEAAENVPVWSARSASIHRLAIGVAASATPARERRKPGAGEMVLGPTKWTPPRGTSPGANSVKLRHPPALMMTGCGVGREAGTRRQGCIFLPRKRTRVLLGPLPLVAQHLATVRVHWTDCSAQVVSRNEPHPMMPGIWCGRVAWLPVG